MTKTVTMEDVKTCEAEAMANRKRGNGRKPGSYSQDVLDFIASNNDACEVVVPENKAVNLVYAAYHNSIRRYGEKKVYLKRCGNRMFLMRGNRPMKETATTTVEVEGDTEQDIAS